MKLNCQYLLLELHESYQQFSFSTNDFSQVARIRYLSSMICVDCCWAGGPALVFSRFGPLGAGTGVFGVLGGGGPLPACPWS